MTKQEQDKNWNELGKEVQGCVIERYKSYDTSDPVLKALKASLEYTYGSHNLQPTLTYEDILKWSKGKDLMRLNKKLEAIGDLILVAKFLNKNEDGSDWVPNIEDWDDMNEDFYTLGIDPADNEVQVVPINKMRFATEIVYFRTEELAQQAIQILGEETIRLAFSTDY